MQSIISISGLKRKLILVVMILLVSSYARGRQAQEFSLRNGLPNTLVKLKTHRPLTIAYLGGSITAANDGWRDQSLAWLKREYAHESIRGINAGLPGTGSDLGAFRLKPQVLDSNPDLVFVEFAVNDGSKSKELIHQTMEGIVRQIRRHHKTTEICFVYTISAEMLATMQGGKLPNSAQAMEDVADFYGIPSVTFGFAVADEVSRDRMVFKGKKEDYPEQTVFSPDGIHPYADTGQKLYADVLSRSLRSIFQQSAPKKMKYRLFAPSDPKNWELASLSPISLEMKKGDWQPISFQTDELRSKLVQLMHGVTKASKAGSSLIIRFNGTMIGLMDIIGPGSAKYEVWVDGKSQGEIRRFDKYCTYYRVHYFILPELPPGDHTVEFRLSAKPIDKAAILKQSDNVIPPERAAEYQEFSGFALGLLLNGHLL